MFDSYLTCCGGDYCSKKILVNVFLKSQNSFYFEFPFLHFVLFYGGVYLHYTISSEPPWNEGQIIVEIATWQKKRPQELISASVAMASFIIPLLRHHIFVNHPPCSRHLALELEQRIGIINHNRLGIIHSFRELRVWLRRSA